MTTPMDMSAVRDPARLSQDVSLWPVSAVELAQRVPDHELRLLRSPDPQLRVSLASDPECSEAAMCLLVGDIELVRLILARRRDLARRAVDMLVATAMEAPADARHGNLTLKALVDNPHAGLGFLYSYPTRSHYRMLAGRYFADPFCEGELLRVFWRVPEVRAQVAGHPNLPDDLVLRAATLPDGEGGREARRSMRERGWDAHTLQWSAVRSFAADHPQDVRESLFSVLPVRILVEAAADEDPRMRAAVAGATSDARVLRRLARDPDEAVRRKANSRLLEALVDP